MHSVIKELCVACHIVRFRVAKVDVLQKCGRGRGADVLVDELLIERRERGAR